MLNRKLVLLFSACLSSSSGLVVAEPMFTEAKPQPVVELAHWWISPGERAALAVIEQAVKVRHGKFKPSKIDNFSLHRKKIIRSISLGYVPAVMHWLGGAELLSLKQQNLLINLPEIDPNQPNRDLLFPEVLSEITVSGEQVALPVGIHLWNRVYFNARIYDELGLEPATSWKELLHQMALIDEAGYVPLLTGNDPWQLGFILDAILLEHGGEQGFQAVFSVAGDIEQHRELLVIAFQSLRTLKTYTSAKFYRNTWDVNTRHLSEGGGAIQFIGDFAKGELMALGHKPGRDFYCAAAPGTSAILYYGVDVFALLKVQSPALQAGQVLLTKTVLDAKVQADYISRKGGLPVRTGIDVTRLDRCAQRTYRDWQSGEKLVIPLPAGNSRQRMQAVHQAASDVWNQPDADIGARVDRLIATVKTPARNP